MSQERTERRVALLAAAREARNATPIPPELLGQTEGELEARIAGYQAERETLRARIIDAARALDHKRTFRSASAKLDGLSASERDALVQAKTLRVSAGTK